MSGSGGLISFISRARKSFISSIWTPPSGTAQINGDVAVTGDQAITGDVAVTGETSLDGGLGADLDAKGQYLLNDQTTTNMMSKGPAYRFDGVDDKVTTGTSTDFDFGTGDGFISAKFRVENLSTLVDLVSRYDSGNDRMRFYLQSDGTFNGYFKKTDGATVQGATFAMAPTAGTEYDVKWVFVNGTSNAMYLNGVPQTLTSTVVTGGTLSYTAGLQFGSTLDGPTYSEVSISEVMLGNFAPSASQVKDILSANTPFKWIGASQTSVVTDGTFDTAIGAGTWTEPSGTSWNIAAGVADYTTGSGGNHVLQQSIVIEKGRRYTIGLDVPTGTTSLFFANQAGAVLFNSVFAAYTSADFPLNVIALNDATAIQLIADDASGTFSIDNFSVVPIGVVADYPSHGISETHWTDASGNNNDGAVTGCEVLNQTDGQAFKNIILSPVGQDATPKEGQLIYNSATNKLNVWTGAAWEVVTSA